MHQVLLVFLTCGEDPRQILMGSLVSQANLKRKLRILLGAFRSQKVQHAKTLTRNLVKSLQSF